MIFGNRIKSVSLTIAVALGFMDKKTAQVAEKYLDENGDHPTLGLLVSRGFLNEEQASAIRAKREKSYPMEELTEHVKKARMAVRNIASSRE